MGIKIGMNLLLWTGHPTQEHIKLLKQLAQIGYDGVEIPVSGQSQHDLLALRDACADLGLKLTTSGFIPAEANPISPDAAIRDAAQDYMKARLDEVALLGGTLFVGGLYQAHKCFTGQPPTQQEWDWSREFLHAAASFAADRNISIGLEFLNRFETHLITNAQQATQMAHDVGHANVGVLYDTHHANIECPSPKTALAQCGDRLMHIHLSESHRGTLGTGQVPWAQTFKALAARDYEGWLTVEAFGLSNPDLIMGANIWQNHFDSEEQLARDALSFIQQALVEHF